MEEGTTELLIANLNKNYDSNKTIVLSTEDSKAEVLKIAGLNNLSFQASLIYNLYYYLLMD